MFRKSLALLIAVLVVVSVPGFTVFVHYCKGEASSFSFLESADPCINTSSHLSESSACCLHKSDPSIDITRSCCVGKGTTHTQSQKESCTEKTKDCCQTEVVKSAHTQLTAYRPQVVIPKPLLQFSFLLPYHSIPRFVASYPKIAITTIPPPLPSLDSDKLVFIASFLI
jgi:hypothetical protein